MNYKKIVINIFVLTMLFPVCSFSVFKSYLDTENKENRELSVLPSFSFDQIDAYPSALETYFTDYLPYKNYLVSAYQNVNYLLFKELPSQKVILGKQDWLFYTGEPGEDPIADYQGTNIFSEEEMLSIKTNIEKAEAYFENRGIEFILLVAPNKEQVYDEYMSDAYKVKDGNKRYDRIVEYLKGNSQVPIINPKAELIAEKENQQVYYKYDSHWNKLGGFIGSQQLIEGLTGKRSYLKEQAISVLEQPQEDLIHLTNLPQYFIDDHEYLINDYKTSVNVKTLKESPDGYLKVYQSNAEDNRTVFFLRDSFGEAIYPYLPKVFQNVTFLHRNAYHINYVNEANPNIVVYEVVERNLDLLLKDGLGLIPES